MQKLTVVFAPARKKARAVTLSKDCNANEQQNINSTQATPEMEGGADASPISIEEKEEAACDNEKKCFKTFAPKL